MKNLQKRLIKSSIIEVRDNEETQERIISGVLPYNSRSERMSLGYSDSNYEVILPTAWNKTLADKRNIFLNYNHNSDLILASTKSGTMQVENKEDGLHWTASLPNTDIGIRAYETIKRGDVSTLSFEFYPVKYKEEDNISYIESGRLEAISVCVANPAYKATTCEARTLKEQIQTIKTAISKEDFKTMDNETLKELKELLTALMERLPKNEEGNKEEAPKEEEAPSTKDERADTPEQPKDTQTADEKEPEEDEDDKEIEELMKELLALKEELKALNK